MTAHTDYVWSGLIHMSLINRARLALSAAASAWSGPGDIRQWPSVWGYQRGQSWSKINVTDQLAQTMSAVWACGSLLADMVSQCPISLFQKVGDDVNKIDPKDHLIAALLNRGFNADLSTTMGVYTGQSQIGIGGNSYFAIVRDQNGDPASLHLLDPYTTVPRLADNVPFDLIQDYEARYQGASYLYDPSDILHIKGHTTRGVIGLSPIAAAREAIGLGLSQEKFGSKFFGDDAKSGGYFISPEQTNARSKKAKQEALSDGQDGEGQGGPDNAHKPKFLDPGVKFIPVTISPEDSQFLQSRGFQIAEISRFYRVPLVFLDSGAATAWGSGIEQLKIGFVELTINPLSDRWADEMTRKLLTPEEIAAGYFIDLDTGVLLLGDMESRFTAYSNAINAGWMVRNQARKLERMNPIPGLDVPLVGVNMQNGTDVPKASEQAAANGDNQSPPPPPPASAAAPNGKKLK